MKYLCVSFGYYWIYDIAVLGAISGSEQFPLNIDSSDTLRLIEASIACNGTESHLRECMVLEPQGDDSTERRCGALQNAYVACQGKTCTL